MRLRFLSADDIFISYSRKDAATYALGLADALTKVGFSCFFDRLGTEAAPELPPLLLMKLKNCAMLVVVGTEGATDSRAMEQEISVFSRANGTSHVVPIDFSGAAEVAIWQPLLTGLAAEGETAEALLHGNPSKQVITRIEKAFAYARSKQRLRWYTALAATLLIVSLVAAGGSYLYAQQQVAQARSAKEISEIARKETDREREAARSAKREADEQTRLAKRAEDQRIKAEAEAEKSRRQAAAAQQQRELARAREREATRQADEQARLAKQAEDQRIKAEAGAEESRRQASAAQQQQELAQAREHKATENAARLEQMSVARRLASQGERILSDRLDLALLLTTESLSIYDTYDTRNALLKALQRRPRLLGYLDAKTLSASGRAWFDAMLSANDELFAVSDGLGITVWDVAKAKKTFVPSERISTFALSSDGKLLAVSTIERLFLWDLQAQRELTEVREPCKYVSNDLIFDPMGKYLAFTCGGTVFVTPIDHADTPLKLPSQSAEIESHSIAFSADGRMLVAVGETLLVWDMKTLTAQKGWPRVVGADKYLKSKYDKAIFSPDGKVLITTSDTGDRLVRWDVAARRQTAEHKVEPVSAVTFNHKGDLLALGGDKGTIWLMDANTMEEVENLTTGGSYQLEQLIFTREDQKLLSIGREVLVWDMSDDQHLATVLQRNNENRRDGDQGDQILLRALGVNKEKISDVAFTPDGKYLVTCGGEDEPVVFRDARGGQPVAQTFSEALKGARRLSFARGGKGLAIVTEENDSEVVQVWDVEKGQLLNTPYRSRGRVGQMAFSPDGELLVVGYFEVTFINAGNGRQLRPPLDLLGPESIGSLTFSEDGEVLAVGTSRSNILLIDTESLEEIGRMSLTQDSAGEGVVQALAFSPDGKTLASNGLNPGTVLLWDIASRKSLGTLVGEGFGYVNAVAFSPDGKLLATTEGYSSLRLLEGNSFKGVRDNVPKTEERSVFLWDIETQQQLGQPLKGHTAEITSLAFTPSCTGCPAEARLVSGDASGTLIMWDVSISSWQRRACAISGRYLTDAERARYFTDSLLRQACSAPHLLAALGVAPAANGRPPDWRQIEKGRPRLAPRSKELAQLSESIFIERRPSQKSNTNAQADDSGGQQTIETRLQRVVGEQLGVSPYILDTTSFAEHLGTGKSEKAALLKAVGKEFGFEIPAEDSDKIVTFKDLLTYVEQRINAVKPK